MPTCVNCGEHEFDCIDGLFYCVECQVQSQDIREEVIEDYEVLSSQKQLRHLVQKDSDASKKKALQGRRWQSHEGFQIILKEQVKALIKLGAKPLLEEAVWRLWKRYLSIVGVAFTHADRRNGNLQDMLYPRPRDVCAVTSDSPDVIPFRLRKTLSEKSNLRMKKQKEKEMTDEAIRQTLGDEDFYDEDDPFAESDEDYHIAITIAEQVKKKEKKSHLSARGMRNRAERLSLLHTLSFCYLGLLCTHHVVSAADIIRWVKQALLPYNRATELFPADMKFSAYDYMTFSHADIPEKHRLRLLTGKLLELLNLPNVPELDICMYISKYIVQLNLPGEFHGFVNGIVRSKPPVLDLRPTSRDKSIPDIDAFAISYIIIALKTLFGLNGYTEKEISRHANSVMKIIPAKLFTWMEWKVQTECCRTWKSRNQMPKTARDAYHVTDVHRCINESKLLSGPEARRTEKGRRRMDMRAGFRKVLSRPLQDLKELLTDQHQQRLPWSALEACDWYQQEQGQHPPSQGQNPQPGGTDFSRYTVQYITNHDSFISSLENQGMTRDNMSRLLGREDRAADMSVSERHQPTPILTDDEDLFSSLPSSGLQSTDLFPTGSQDAGGIAADNWRSASQEAGGIAADNWRSASQDAGGIDADSWRSAGLTDLFPAGSQEAGGITADNWRAAGSTDRFPAVTQDSGGITADSSRNGMDLEMKKALDEHRMEVEEMLEKIQDFVGYYTMHFVSEVAEHSESVQDYRWLLEFCSEEAGCSPEVLEKFVEQLEYIYVCDSKPENKSERLKRKKFQRKYFEKIN